MEEPRNRYILLQDRVGWMRPRGWLMVDLIAKLYPRHAHKGELLEALPDDEQPGDSTRIALDGIDRNLRLECRTEDVKKLTLEEADLLLPISCAQLRFEIYFDRRLLDFGKRLEYGSHVLVLIEGVSKILPGVVRFKGELLNSTGTMFGIELHKNPGYGTCDETFRNERYFRCAPDSNIFVGLDKLAPLKDENSKLRTPSKSPKSDKDAKRATSQEQDKQPRDEQFEENVSSRQSTALDSGVEDHKNIEVPHGFQLGTMVEVPVPGGQPTFGVIRWIGNIPEVKDKLFAGLELEQETSACSDGTFYGTRYFTCQSGRGFFCMLENCRKDSRFTPNSPSSDKVPSGKGKSDSNLPQPRNCDTLKIDQRVVTFCDEGRPLRGTVRYTGEREDSSGHVQIIVGLELDERCGSGTGMWKGNRFFVCKRDHACFVDIESIMLEDDFDEGAERAKKNVTSQKQDKQLRDLKMQERKLDKEIPTRSLSYNVQHEASDEQFEENASSRQSTSLDSGGIVAARESKTSNNPFIAAPFLDIHQLKDENERLKHEKTKLEKERDDLLAQQGNYERELQEIKQEKDEIVKQKDNLQTDLRAKEFQVHELETSLTTAQQALEDMQQLKDENNKLKLEKCQLEKEKSDFLAQKENFEKELYNVREEKDELVVQNCSLQTDLRAKEAEVHRLETTLATAQRALEECQQIKKPCDWVVSRDEVEMTDKCLGVGGWGKVVLGTFRGCKVAVKEIHELILSPYNRRLFEREMNIASKCRHPCLLQFIGATNDDGIPLFITELLDTSLRALLEQRQLAETEISIISLDVSLALNYLHNMKPSPILHRDVSSANVLLWQQGDQWRGKVSDYGTAKFVQQTMTRAPGAVIYSAPEAVSSNQTPKVDVYSFGVLVCEMCIREMPDPERRNQQVLLVKSHIFRNLVHECLKANPVERPEMSQIIQEIQRFEGLNQMVNKC